MEIDQLRAEFTDYFENLGYKRFPAAPVISIADPTVLFTTAGMQQFKDYYTGSHPTPSPKIVTVQPVVRTTDIADVGDSTHLTMFEMLGNFRFTATSSLNLKREAISEAWCFVTEKLAVSRDRIYVTIFGGDKSQNLPSDHEAEGIWRALGVEDIRPVNGLEENFWGPVGKTGPCGPNTEIYVDGIEVWNLVFNQYFKNEAGQFELLKNVGLDTGSGLERFSSVLQKKNSVWQISPFRDWVLLVDPEGRFESRVIVDHLKTAVFLITAGVRPGNKGRDYVLRRLIRKAVFLARRLRKFDWNELVDKIGRFYAIYGLNEDRNHVLEVLHLERGQFERNLARAVGTLERWQEKNPSANKQTVTELAFQMFESFGFPKELVIEHLVSEGYEIDVRFFDELFAKHQQASRSGTSGQFKGGLADHSEQTIKHHTATHMLLAALRRVLGNDVVQRGSNVNRERLRLDFKFDRKLTEQEIKAVENLVNEKIQEDLPVTKEELPKEAALASGAQAEFGHKYGDVVTVYSIGDFSKELCGGPHVEQTGQLGRFEILKEEASSSGVRRIRARTV